MIVGRKQLALGVIKLAPELEKIQSLMPISKTDKDKLRESIHKHGVKDALRGYYKGTQFYLLSGVNRLEIAKELGLSLVPIEELELKPKNRESYAIDENISRRQLTTRQKQTLIDYLLAKNPQASSRSIAKKTGTDHKTVEARRKSHGEFPHLKRQGMDGKTYMSKQAQKSPKAIIDKGKKKAFAFDPHKQKEKLRDAFNTAIKKFGQGLRQSDIKEAFQEAKQSYNDI